MKKIKYFCCLAGLLLIGMACQDDENEMVAKPEGITYGTVVDKAGNEYKTLTVGKQTWLAENFRYCPEDATPADQVSYGELFAQSHREVLEGTDRATYTSWLNNQYIAKEFLFYIREQLFAAVEEGLLPTDRAQAISNSVTMFRIPVLLYQYGSYMEYEELLMEIWNNAADHIFGVDKAYLEQYGYLYSHDGALRAVKEGAPEGFHLPTDAEWMMLERALGMDSEELEGLENWRGNVGDLLKAGGQGIGFDALYGGAAIYALSTSYNSRYVHRGEEAYFWSSDKVFVSDSLSNGIVRNISCYYPGIRRMTSRLITSSTQVCPSYSVRLVKAEN